jgi:myosin V
MHAFDERNYHIFYQLLSTDDEMKSRIWTGLVGRTTTDFKYVGMSMTGEIGGVHDAVKFQETWFALGRLAVPENSVIFLMRAICLVMLLGNLEFTVDPSSDDKAHLIEESITSVSNLLGVDKEDLLKSFTERTMTTRGEVFKVPLSVLAASEARDSFAKEVYIRSFLWLVDTMNSKTSAERILVDSDSDCDFGVIGILDIFGFESFKTNRFEQLCINYANEKLQQKAINDIFVAVREEYTYEGIHLDHVDFTSNQQVLDFIEGKTGLIALLNEESYRPKGNNKAFTMKVFEKFNALSLIVKPPAGNTNMFGIVHFAGTVMYTTDNFVMGNQDTLPHDLKVCMSKSTNPIVSGSLLNSTINLQRNENSSVFLSSRRQMSKSIVSTVVRVESKNSLHDQKPEGTSFDFKKGENSQKLIPSSSTLDQVKASFFPRAPMYKRMESDIVAPTVGTKYRNQISLLLRKLGGTHSRYVRCIKPNQEKHPSECNLLLMTEQIRSAGIVPALVLSKSLFSRSISNKILTVKYRILWDKDSYPSKVKRVDKKETRLRLEAEAILNSIFKVPQDQITGTCKQQYHLFFVGKTKTYFRQGIFERLEEKHLNVMQSSATAIQRYVRGKYIRNKSRKKMQSAIIINSWCQRHLKIRRAKFYEAALLIQKYFRMYFVKQTFKNKKAVARWLYCMFWKKKYKTGALKLQTLYRRYSIRQEYILLKKKSSIIQI